MAQIHDPTTVVRMADDQPITETVIFTVAEARDVSPSELDQPLYDVIDGEALRRLLAEDTHRPGLASTRVEFEWAGCTVVVHGNGRVVVTTASED